MTPAEVAMTETAARRLALIQGEDEKRGDLLIHQGLARLIVAMMLDCRGTEDCSSCTLGGLGVCTFEHLTCGATSGPSGQSQQGAGHRASEAIDSLFVLVAASSERPPQEVT